MALTVELPQSCEDAIRSFRSALRSHAAVADDHATIARAWRWVEILNRWTDLCNATPGGEALLAEASPEAACQVAEIRAAAQRQNRDREAMAYFAREAFCDACREIGAFLGRHLFEIGLQPFEVWSEAYRIGTEIRRNRLDGKILAFDPDGKFTAGLLKGVADHMGLPGGKKGAERALCGLTQSVQILVTFNGEIPEAFSDILRMEGAFPIHLGASQCVVRLSGDRAAAPLAAMRQVPGMSVEASVRDPRMTGMKAGDPPRSGDLDALTEPELEGERVYLLMEEGLVSRHGNQARVLRDAVESVEAALGCRREGEIVPAF